MRSRIGVIATLACVVVLSVDGSVLLAQQVAFTKKVNVLGVPIYATNTTGDDKLMHAAGVLAQYIDNDEDGKPDNPKILEAIIEAKGAIVMTKTQEERRNIPRDSRPNGQGLYDEETRPNAKAKGVFDTALEEILHMVSDYGWGGAYFTSFLGAQDIPGRLEQIGHEWKLNTRELLKERDPAVFEILSRPEYKFPSVAPDGNYTGTKLTIEPYTHQP